MRGITFLLIVCFLATGLTGLAQAQNKTESVLHYTFPIDPKGDGRKIKVSQGIKKISTYECLIEFTFIHRGKEIRHQDRYSSYPLPLDEMTFCKAEVVRIGKVGTLEYTTGVGVSGIKSRKKLIFDPVNNRVIDIQYAKGGASDMRRATQLGKKKYLLPLLEASYILPGVQDYGPPLYSGYVVKLLDKGINVIHILNPVVEPDPKSGNYIERIHSPQWCEFFYKKQIKEYKDALKIGDISKDGKAEINQLINKTKKFCDVK